MIKLTRHIILCCLLGALVSCAESDPKNISEGIIEYDAKVVDEKHPMAGLAPGSMSLHFKKDKFSAEMSTMGVFKTSFIVDIGKKEMIQLVKVFEDKSATIVNETAIMEDNKDYVLDLKETKETKIIAGYLCYKVECTRKDDPSQKFDVFYTNEIKVKMPNFANPYSKIKGMLMEYRMKKFGLEMHFIATSVKATKVENAEFEIPSNYKQISNQEMKELFQSLNP